MVVKVLVVQEEAGESCMWGWWDRTVDRSGQWVHISSLVFTPWSSLIGCKAHPDVHVGLREQRAEVRVSMVEPRFAHVVVSGDDRETVYALEIAYVHGYMPRREYVRGMRYSDVITM
jgi:hypothetical protein